MTSVSQLHGVYAITDPLLCGNRLIEKVTAAIAGGVRILQYRNKQANAEQQRKEASELQDICRRHDVLFIINDNIALAREVDADGVHLGQQDASLQEAREIMGKEKIIGVSCNNRLEYALAAEQGGADYIAFGRFYPSQTKPQAPQADIQLLEQAHRKLHIPIVAIGGITPDNGGELLAAGAQMLAVIHGIFSQPDIQRAARDYSDLFHS